MDRNYRGDVAYYLGIIRNLSLIGSGLVVTSMLNNEPPAPLGTKLCWLSATASPQVIAIAIRVGRIVQTLLSPINQQLRERHRIRLEQEPARVEEREKKRSVTEFHRQEQERQRAIRSALGELNRFYVRHQRVLQSECPPALFLARREAEITSDMTGPQAWNAVHEMMASLYPIVLEHKKHERQRLDDERILAERKRDIERRLAKNRSKLERLKSSPLAAVALEGEIYRVENQITDLEDELSNCEYDRPTNAHQRL